MSTPTGRPVALVAGIGPGLGVAVAEALAAAGHDLVLAARSALTYEDLAGRLRAAGARVVLAPADFTRAPDRAELAACVRDEFGRLDALVHNAYVIGPHGDFDQADLQAWRAVMEVNLWSPLELLRELLPLLRAADRGSVVLVGAMTSRMVSARGRGGYALSKAALNQAVRTLAFELGPEKIRVNAVLPGWMDNASLAEWRSDPERAPLVEKARAAIPLGEIPTTAEVAGSVVFLASPAAGAVTGHLLDANGGHYMA